jgi:hypothetical protein
MTLNEAIHRLCQQARSDIDSLEHQARITVNPDTKASLHEDISKLSEALSVVAESRLERPDDRSAAESFLETVRDRL